MRLDRFYGIHMRAGPASLGLHQDIEGSYSFVRGAMRNTLVVAAWNLTDSGGEHRVISDCRFRERATKYVSKSGIKWLSCTAKWLNCTAK